MKKVIAYFIISLFIITLLFQSSSYANSPPPKDDFELHLIFENVDNEYPCYATILWDEIFEESNHKDSLYDTDPQKAYEISTAFASYKDVDNYNVPKTWWKCSEDTKLIWSTYRKGNFKVLIYLPDLEEFIVSKEYARGYADNYYSVNIKKALNNLKKGNHELKIEKGKGFKQEVNNLLWRMFFTIAIELFIALLFGFRKIKQILIIFFTNVFTQLLLNILMHLLIYNEVADYFIILIVVEFLVFILESSIYIKFLNKFSKKPASNTKIVTYTFIANLISLFLGLLLSIGA